MPTYDYECTKCGQIFEMIQSITANPKRKPEKPCAGCGKKALIRRLLGTGGAILFKGTGFYETDYRSDSYKKAAEADKKKQTSGSDKKDSGKTETGKTDTAKKSDTKGEKSTSTSKSGAAKPKKSD